MIGLHHYVHTMGVPVINAVRTRLVGRTIGFGIFLLSDLGLRQGLGATALTLLKVPGLEVKRMAAVQVAVDRITYVSSIDGRSEVIVETKTVNSFAQAVEVVVLWQVVYKLNKLILVNEFGVLGCEYDVSGRATLNIEPKRWLIPPCIPVSSFS